MQRNDDLLRDLLLELEASSDWEHLSVLHLGSDEAEMSRHFHLLLLADAGMVVATDDGGDVFRITNAGYDFLALTRESEAWEATKVAGRRLGGASIQMLYRIAEGFARQKLADLGIPLA